MPEHKIVKYLSLSDEEIEKIEDEVNENEKPAKYDPRNKLNDLTGKEWIKFLKSWFIFDALQSDLKEEREVTKDTDQHPATFSPTMIADFIKFFTKKGMTVLDPFVGIGSTLIACQRTERNGIGIELNPEFAKIAKKRVKKGKDAKGTEQIIITENAENIRKLNLPEADFCITSPPYWSMLKKIDVNQKMRIEKGLMTDYGELEKDLGNIKDYEEFLEKILNIFDQIYDVLRNKAYMVIIVQNIVDGGKYIPFAWDLAIRLSRRKFVLKKEKIWCQDHKQLYPFGYPYAWVSNTFHHYCLIFRKEE